MNHRCFHLSRFRANTLSNNGIYSEDVIFFNKSYVIQSIDFVATNMIDNPFLGSISPIDQEKEKSKYRLSSLLRRLRSSFRKRN